jgi:AraC-like DNA-binding protein
MARTWQNRIEWTSLARLAGYSCATMADLLGISLRQVQRHFRFSCRQTTHSWLYELRMLDAARLMASSLRIYEVAGLLGYKTSSHFHRDFKRYYGVIPSRYKPADNAMLVGECFLAQYTELLETAPPRLAKQPDCAGRLPVTINTRARIAGRRTASRIGNLSSL